MEVFRVFGRIALEGADRVQNQLQGLDSRAQSVADKFSRAGQKMRSVGTGLSVGLTAPLTLAGKAAIDLALDAEEVANKFNVVFKDSAASARAELERMGQVMPNTRAELETMAAGVQDLLVPLGISREEAAGMSTQFVKLAGDIAAFNNTTPERAMEAIRSALVGSAEPMLQFGVDTRKTTLEQHALEEGIIAAGESMNQQQRAAAVLSQIMKQSADAIGTAAREADSAAGKKRILARDIRELATTLGQDLMPLFERLVQVVGQVVNWFSGLDDNTRQFITTIAAISAVVGPVLVVFGTIASAIGKIIGVFRVLIPIVVKVVGALRMFTPVGLAITAAVAAIIAVFKNWETIMPVVVNAWEAAVDKVSQGIEAFVDGFNWLKQKFGEVMDTIVSWAQSKWEAVKNAFQTAFDFIKGIWDSVVGTVSGAIESIMERVTALKDKFIGAWEAIRDGVVNIVTGMVDRVRGMIDALYRNTVGRMQQLWNTLVGNSIVVDIADDVVSEMARMADGSIEEADRFARGVQDAAGFNHGVGGFLGGQRSGGGGTVIDMRHSTFRDDRHLDERLRRSGHTMAGAF